jgi:hypothetical protein
MAHSTIGILPVPSSTAGAGFAFLIDGDDAEDGDEEAAGALAAIATIGRCIGIAGVDPSEVDGLADVVAAAAWVSGSDAEGAWAPGASAPDARTAGAEERGRDG